MALSWWKYTSNAYLVTAGKLNENMIAFRTFEAALISVMSANLKSLLPSPVIASGAAGSYVVMMKSRRAPFERWV